MTDVWQQGNGTLRRDSAEAFDVRVQRLVDLLEARPDLAGRKYWRVKPLCAYSGMSKAKVYLAIHAGRLDARRLDGCVLITAVSALRWLDSAEPYEGT